MYRRTTNPLKFLVGLIMSCVPGAPKKTPGSEIIDSFDGIVNYDLSVFFSGS